MNNFKVKKKRSFRDIYIIIKQLKVHKSIEENTFSCSNCIKLIIISITYSNPTGFVELSHIDGIRRVCQQIAKGGIKLLVCGQSSSRNIFSHKGQPVSNLGLDFRRQVVQQFTGIFADLAAARVATGHFNSLL